MSNPILKQAVVIGAGMGGLAAAKALPGDGDDGAWRKPSLQLGRKHAAWLKTQSAGGWPRATESAPSSAPSLGCRSFWELDSASCFVDSQEGPSKGIAPITRMLGRQDRR